ncbi:hypothetical protein GGX14DRAFT_362653 [Mycena pura]|uniref:DUF7729 domain-containing protein n=1 Tax=Mycena pura TaxID=153505 RepID=A0AAD6VF32_9AGAR|nr:hypothetical protein GGX14DRAFT_362653 [Mycena pura]
MLTPPPSPRYPSKNVPDHVDIALPPATPPSSPDSLKQRIGRRTKWTIMLVPMVLILITASTRYLTHPAAFDMFSEPTVLDWETFSSGSALDWTPHKRHPLPAAAADPSDAVASTLPSQSASFASSALQGASVSTSASASPTTAPPAQQTVPTVPASPPTLPTPFPQPFDSELSQNFSSISCFNFFSNMTNTLPFRECRAFSLLLQTSAAFIEAQADLNLLNSIVWGTCDPDTSDTQCSANMAWFSTNLVSSCQEDLKDGNSMAVNTQIALNAFDLMRSAGCLVDPTTNTYCYIDAAHNSNPSDTYFYSLPLGVSIPNNTIASCSACTKSLMTLYYSALSNSSQAQGLTSLQDTYLSGAKIAVADCGPAYATLATRSGAARPVQAPLWSFVGSTVLVILLSTFLYLP